MKLPFSGRQTIKISSEFISNNYFFLILFNSNEEDFILTEHHGNGDLFDLINNNQV